MGGVVRSRRARSPFEPQSEVSHRRCTKDTATKPKKKKTSENSDQEFRDGYRAPTRWCRLAIQAAFAAFQALDADDTPDVAKLHGLHRPQDGRLRSVEILVRARAGGRPEARTYLQYYGMWQVEQGNMLKAADYLENIRLISAPNAKEYRDLKGRHGRHCAY